MFANAIRSNIHPATWAVLGVKLGPGGGQCHRGTAFAVDGSGHLLTCWHVTYMDNDQQVECDEFRVLQPELSVTTQYRATLVAKEKDRDIALLKIDGAVKTRPAMLNA